MLQKGLPSWSAANYTCLLTSKLRTYALQHAKPAILRSSIRKPDIFSSNCPSIIYGLLNHISLFEMLPNDLYTWGFTSSSSLYTQASLAASVCHALCEAKSAKSMVASQHLDTLVTQEWLKTEMWKLSLGWRPNSLSSGGPLLSFLLPFSAGKFTMEALTSVDASSRDACGIAMVGEHHTSFPCLTDHSKTGAEAFRYRYMCCGHSPCGIELLYKTL